MPADHDLRRGHAVCLGDPHERTRVEVARPERAVALELHPARAMLGKRCLLVQRRAPLDLVERGQPPGRALELVELPEVVVADADRPGEPVRLCLQEPLPYVRPCTAAGWPVDEPEVDAVEAERGETRLERLPLAPGAVGPQLRRHEDVVRGEAALGDRAADLALVAVHLRRVDAPVAELERPADRRLHLVAARLPGPEPDERHPDAGCDLDTVLDRHPYILQDGSGGAAGATPPQEA